jgi:hypothetical protein
MPQIPLWEVVRKPAGNSPAGVGGGLACQPFRFGLSLKTGKRQKPASRTHSRLEPGATIREAGKRRHRAFALESLCGARRTSTSRGCFQRRDSLMRVSFLLLQEQDLHSIVWPPRVCGQSLSSMVSDLLCIGQPHSRGQERATMAENNEQHWRALCAAAAEEPDSEKVAWLVDQILEALDEPRDVIRTDQPS